MANIHITEKQLHDLAKLLSENKSEINEVALAGDPFLAKTNDVKTAAGEALGAFANEGGNVNDNGASVNFSADALRKHGVSISANECWAPLTKKQIDEKRLEIRKANCNVLSKKDLF